ncbi:MAG TPA: hypothetical protein VMV76_02825 [Dehalococcoidia bacterium]|nr:hypothetical protein [Dehalococcoidia bacterium]
MGTGDIRATIPSNIRDRLLPDEKVLYYASGGGCLRGPRTYFLITDSRAMLSAVRKGGCLGIGASAEALDIPLEHITSVGTKTSGCFFARSGVVSVSSGTASEEVVLTTPKSAEEASITLQKILRERRKGG